jgi:hypothetical protein
MKLHHFGLWFEYHDYDNRRDSWSKAIPEEGFFEIYYDGQYLGYQNRENGLCLYYDGELGISLRESLPDPPRRLRLEDFYVTWSWLARL